MPAAVPVPGHRPVAGAVVGGPGDLAADERRRTETLLDVDVIGFCLPADQKVGPGDQYIAKDLAELQRVRRKPVVAIVTKTDKVDRERLAEHLIEVPAVSTLLQPLLSTIPMQFLAAEIARQCGNEDIDKPRNLAKSVTVE